MTIPDQPFDLEVFLATVDSGRTIRIYRRNETVFAQGDRCDGVFYIRRGECKITVVSEQGKEAVIALHRKGDFFGEGCLNGQPRRLATAIAINDCELMRFENSAIQRVLHDEPRFSELFISHLLSRTARVEADLVDQLFNSSEKRLARLLLLMANFGKEGRTEPVIAKISQATLAEMIGTTRSRVSLFMNKFRKLGFVEYNGDLKVHNSLLNVILHDDPKSRPRPTSLPDCSILTIFSPLAFYAGRRSCDMSMLMIRCPQTGEGIQTGIETDEKTLQNMPNLIAYTRCPHCGFEHAWWPDEGWLTDTLPRVAA